MRFFLRKLFWFYVVRDSRSHAYMLELLFFEERDGIRLLERLHDIDPGDVRLTAEIAYQIKSNERHAILFRSLQKKYFAKYMLNISREYQQSNRVLEQAPRLSRFDTYVHFLAASIIFEEEDLSSLKAYMAVLGSNAICVTVRIVYEEEYQHVVMLRRELSRFVTRDEQDKLFSLYRSFLFEVRNKKVAIILEDLKHITGRSIFSWALWSIRKTPRLL